MGRYTSITAFETSDGKVFKLEEEADKHEKELIRKEFNESWVVTHLGRVTSPTFTSDEIVAALNDHGLELLKSVQSLNS